MRGFAIGTKFVPEEKKMSVRQVFVYHFSKAKKTDTHPKFGHKAEYGDVTYALVKHCPFCGAQIET